MYPVSNYNCYYLKNNNVQIIWNLISINDFAISELELIIKEKKLLNSIQF